MTLDFADWILKRKQSQVGTKSAGAKSVSVDVGSPIGKVQVFQSEAGLLKLVSIVDRVAVYPIDPKVVSSVTSWSEQPEAARRQVAQKLVEALSEASKKSPGWKEQPEAPSKVKASLRVATVKNLLADQSSPVERFLPDAKYSLVLTSTYPSLLALSNQLVPYLLSGIAVTVVSNADTAVQVAYLLDVLLDLGLPSGVLTQLIDLEVGNGGQIVSFVLLDDADIHSALDSALASQLVYGVPSVKIFAQDSLKSTVQQVLSHKVRIQFADNELFFENELWNQARADVKVNTDAVNFETDASGLDVYYYRTAGEALKMVNHLQGPLRQRWVSVWSEKTSLALRVAQGVQSCKQVSINAGIPGYNSFGGWQFELIARSALSRLASDNAELALQSLASLNNKSWSTSVITRVRAVHSVLDNLKLANGATVRVALPRTTTEVDDVSSDSTMWLNTYQPIGQIIVQLSEAQTVDDTCLLSFGLSALVFGNSLVLVGKAANKQLATWKKVQELLEKQGFTGAVQTIASDKDIKVESTSLGALQLVGSDGETVQAVYIEQSKFAPELYSRLLRRVARSIALSLSEYEMSKIVE